MTSQKGNQLGEVLGSIASKHNFRNSFMDKYADNIGNYLLAIRKQYRALKPNT